MVFVYGSLRRNEPNYHFLQDQNKYGRHEFVGIGKTVQKLPLIVASKYNIPFLLDSPAKGHHVEGRVFITSKH